MIFSGWIMKKEEQNKSGISLLQKGKKGVVRMIFSRFGIILLLLAVQVLFLFGLFFKFRQLAPHYLAFASFFYLLMIVVLINSNHDASSKITWLIILNIERCINKLISWEQSFCTYPHSQLKQIIVRVFWIIIYTLFYFKY